MFFFESFGTVFFFFTKPAPEIVEPPKAIL